MIFSLFYGDNLDIMQKITYLLVAILILSACAPSESFIQTAVAQTQTALPTSTVAPTATPIPTATIQPTATLDTQAYRAAVDRHTSAWLAAYSDFQGSFKEVREDTNLLRDASWKTRMNNAMDSLIAASAELDSITPVPPEFEIANGYLEQLASETRQLVLAFKLLLGGDTTQADAIIEHNNKAVEYMQFTFDEMKRLAP